MRSDVNQRLWSHRRRPSLRHRQPRQNPQSAHVLPLGSKLAKSDFILAVKNVMRGLTRRFFETYPDFGKSVAIDSTPVKAWANAQKKASGRNSDPDAGWTVKKGTNGKVKYVWGYKVHILVDTQYEIPISTDITAGNVHDIKKAAPLLSQARYITRTGTANRFKPDYVMADPAYSSRHLNHIIRTAGHFAQRTA